MPLGAASIASPYFMEFEMAKKVKVRVLVDTIVDGKDYKPNQVVSFDPATAKDLEKEGKVDSSPAAVKHCESEGAKVIEHGAPDSGEPAGPAVDPAL